MPNLLAHEKSPYLLQHAAQPVEWMPWGEAAFARARSEGKPIFLSAGYSTCHWCHVMAHESFDDPAVAAVLNALFVNVKLDREERPDVDRLYMTFIQATTGHGGWPMSVWLTPELKPFYGGTYFPPRGSHGRPGFVEILRAIGEAWRADRERVVAQAASVVEALREHTLGGTGRNPSIPEPAEGDLRLAAAQFLELEDAENGGFGGAPKFPRPATLLCLSRVLHRLEPGDKDREPVRNALSRAVRAMAAGGIHDHLGGGFHRYTVDARWHVPHFEKMLYDQGQMAVALADATQQLGLRELRPVLRLLLDYVGRDLTHPDGGCYSAEDADSEVPAGSEAGAEHCDHGDCGCGDKRPAHRSGEGAFYLWRDAELRALLGAETYQKFGYAYGVEPGGNVNPAHDPHGEFTGANILERRQDSAAVAARFGGTPASLEAELGAARAKLFETRKGRPRPHLDDKVIAGWNGLMLSGCARAAQALGDESAAAQGTRLAAFLRRELWDESTGKLYRCWRSGRSPVAGFAEDYACVAQGLIDLYETTFDWGHLAWALRLQERMIELFHDREHGGFFSSAEHAPDLVLRLKDDYDGAEPTPSSVAALNLARLASMLAREDLRALALETTRAFAHRWRNAPATMPAMVAAADFLAGPVKQVVLSGELASHDTFQLIRTVHGVFCPRKVVLLDDRGAGRAWLAERVPFIAALPVDAPPTAHVCGSFVCEIPTTSPVKLRELLLRA